MDGAKGKRRDQRQPGDYDSAEPSDELELRLLRAWDYVLERVASHPRARQLGQGGSTEQEPLLQVMVLSHGAAIRALVSGLFSRRAAEYEVKPGVDVHKGIANCSVTEFHVERTEKGELTRMVGRRHPLMRSSRQGGRARCSRTATRATLPTRAEQSRLQITQTC